MSIVIVLRFVCVSTAPLNNHVNNSTLRSLHPLQAARHLYLSLFSCVCLSAPSRGVSPLGTGGCASRRDCRTFIRERERERKRIPQRTPPNVVLLYSNVLSTMSERTAAAPAEAPCETPAETDEQETPLFMTRMPIKLNDALEAIAAIIDEEEVPTSSSVHSAPASSNTSRKRRSGLGAAQVALSLSCIAEAETLHLPAKRGRCIGREAHPLESGLLTGEGRVWV